LDNSGKDGCGPFSCHNHKKEIYSLPRIDDTLDALGGAKHFSAIKIWVKHIISEYIHANASAFSTANLDAANK
jgi:hypothetical protein